MFGRSTAGRVVGKVSVTVVLGIFAGEWWVYHVACRPSPGLALLFNALLLMAVWSYLQTALTDPGTPESPEWEEWATQRDTLSTPPASEVKEEERVRCRRPRGWAPGEVTWCHDCSRERPERAHHCSQCGVCILRMDHHCPWIGSCVGWRNHKYFLLLNWWSFWASMVFLLTLRSPNCFEAFDLLSMVAEKQSLAPTTGVIAAVAFVLITGGMFAHATAMVLRNVTVVEELFPGKNPYCRGSNLENARQLLGPLDLRLLLPLQARGRSRGTSFQATGTPAATVAAEERGSLASAAEQPPKYGSV